MNTLGISILFKVQEIRAKTRDVSFDTIAKNYIEVLLLKRDS